MIFSLLFIILSCELISAFSCGDMSVYRTQNVIDTFDITKANGFFYENAYHDIAQFKSICQWYNKQSSSTSLDYSEEFGFTYTKPGHMNLKYNLVNETIKGLYYKNVAKPKELIMFDGIIPKIQNVIVDAILGSDGTYEYISEYACFAIGPITYKEIRIGSRNPSISNTNLLQMEKTIKDLGIEYKKLNVVNHDGCEYDI